MATAVAVVAAVMAVAAAAALLMAMLNGASYEWVPAEIRGGSCPQPRMKPACAR
jgi:hypothetical protein